MHCVMVWPFHRVRAGSTAETGSRRQAQEPDACDLNCWFRLAGGDVERFGAFTTWPDLELHLLPLGQ